MPIPRGWAVPTLETVDIYGNDCNSMLTLLLQKSSEEIPEFPCFKAANEPRDNHRGIHFWLIPGFQLVEGLKPCHERLILTSKPRVNATTGLISFSSNEREGCYETT